MIDSDLILHPLRLRIMRCLGTQTRTPQQIAAQMPDIAQATLYRHLKKLEVGGVIAVVHQEPKRGTLEKSYRLARGDISQEELENYQAADWEQLLQRFYAGLISDFQRYLAAPTADPLRDGLGFRQMQIQLSPAEFKQMAEALNQALLPYLNQETSPERRGYNLATLLIPEPEASS
jgi:DNA-binding transcriptional ArsR family regulator